MSLNHYRFTIIFWTSYHGKTVFGHSTAEFLSFTMAFSTVRFVVGRFGNLVMLIAFLPFFLPLLKVLCLYSIVIY